MRLVPWALLLILLVGCPGEEEFRESTGVLAVTPTWMEEGTQISVAVTGQNFDETAEVFIGGLPASSVTYVSEARLDAMTPQAITAADRPYDVLVSLADGRRSTLPGAFEVRVAAGGCGCASSVASGAAGVAGLVLLPLLALRRRRTA